MRTRPAKASTDRAYGSAPNATSSPSGKQRRMFPDPIQARTVLSPSLRLLDPDAEGCAHLFVLHEQVLGALALRSEGRLAMEPTHGAVDGLMGAVYLRRHQIRPIKIR